MPLGEDTLDPEFLEVEPYAYDSTLPRLDLQKYSPLAQPERKYVSRREGGA